MVFGVGSERTKQQLRTDVDGLCEVTGVNGEGCRVIDV